MINEESKPDDYCDRAVCFVDILGFASLIRKLDESPDSHLNLLRALQKIKGLDGGEVPGVDPSQVEVSVFSDSIVLTARPQHLASIIWVCGHLQADLLELGIATRGGIAVGRTYHKDGILFGEGMLEAYKIEQSAAVYPRVVLHPELVEDVANLRIFSFMDRDADGLCFIDPFQFAPVPAGAAELAAEGYDPLEPYFSKVRDLIGDSLAEAREVNHRAKWRWLANRWNVAIERHNKGIGGCIAPIPADCRIDERRSRTRRDTATVASRHVNNITHNMNPISLLYTRPR